VFDSVGPGATVIAVIPGVSSLESPSLVSFSMVYGAIAGGPANINGTLSISACAAASSFTNIAPYAAFTAVADQAYVSPAAGTPDGIVVTFTNSSGTATVSDVVVTIVLKCKHIA
jgi:hypothetical protein